MIILTKEILDNNEAFSNILEREKLLINLNLEIHKNYKNICLDYIQNFANSTDTIDKNITLLTDLSNLLDEVIVKIKDKTINTELINNFNLKYFETNENVLQNTLKIENCYTNNIEITPMDQKEKISQFPIVEKLVEPISTSEIVENTLIISEAKGKIILPYTTNTLNSILLDNFKKYSSIEEIIEKEYTLPFDLFKNPAISRFKEAFKLMRKKENESVKNAFDLGMELFFNYNLHPAIIAACENLDQLDIYLDYLENNETHKFNCFKILFEIAPAVVKKSKRS